MFSRTYKRSLVTLCILLGLMALLEVWRKDDGSGRPLYMFFWWSTNWPEQAHWPQSARQRAHRGWWIMDKVCSLLLSIQQNGDVERCSHIFLMSLILKVSVRTRSARMLVNRLDLFLGSVDVIWTVFVRCHAHHCESLVKRRLTVLDTMPDYRYILHYIVQKWNMEEINVMWISNGWGHI